MFRKGLEAAGLSIHEYREEERNVSARVADFAGVNEEIRVAATWARQCVETDGDTTVGILTPNLRKLRNRIRYIFEDVLAPGNLSYRDTAAPLTFSISIGQPLANYPLIHVVFSLLGLDNRPLALETLGALLRTPFINGHEQERGGRALLDEKLRSRNQLTFTLDDVLYFADAAGKRGQPHPRSCRPCCARHAHSRRNCRRDSHRRPGPKRSPDFSRSSAGPETAPRTAQNTSRYNPGTQCWTNLFP